ncbi:MAG: putative Ig domain-containing protein, partial [Sphingobacteriaceae bacterium]|nr:putative Ig domain-containing protein [Sphingobacteriaceae bacterium]
MKKLFTIISVALLMLSFMAKAQTITSFSPTSGHVGSVLTVTGTGLAAVSNIKVNGVSTLIISKEATQAVVMVMPNTTTGKIDVNGVLSTNDFKIEEAIMPNSNQTKLQGTPVTTNAKQGWSVAVSAEGQTAILGAPEDDSDRGAVFIFILNNGTWTKKVKLIAPAVVGVGSAYGYSVALSADGKTALVGAYGVGGGQGSAYVYRYDGANWTPEPVATLNASTNGADGDSPEGQGFSVALSADGKTALVGGAAANANIGAAYLFTTTNWTTWNFDVKLQDLTDTSDARQGNAVALSADGKTAIVGGSGANGNTGAVWIYKHNGTNWTTIPKVKLQDNTGYGSNSAQGSSVALSSDGKVALVGAPAFDGTKGGAFVYTFNGTWSKTAVLNAVNTASVSEGTSVSLSADGKMALVGGPGFDTGVGAAWVHKFNGTDWTSIVPEKLQYLTATVINQGWFVSLSADGETALAGAPIFDNGGAAWVYTPPPPPSIKYSVAEVKAILNTTVLAYTPIVTNDVGATYSIDPSVLPTGIDFNVNNGQITGKPTALAAATTYTVTISNSGQSSLTTINISVGQLPILKIGGLDAKNYTLIANQLIAPIVITRSGGAINTSISGGMTVTTVLPAGLSLNVTTSQIEGTPTAIVVGEPFTIRAYNEFGASNDVIVTFSIYSPLTATFVQTNVLVNGQATGAINITPSGGSAAYTYTWPTSAITTANRSGLVAGTYTCVIKSGTEVFTQTIEITQPSALTATFLQTNVLVNGQATGAINITATGGGTLPYVYTWQPSAGNVPNLTNLVAGTYTCVIKSGTEVLTRTIVITQPLALTATFVQTNVLVNGQATGAITITAAGGGTLPYIYEWQPSGGNVPNLTSLVAGTYTCVIKSGTEVLTRTIVITQPLALTATFTKTDVLINGQATGTINITATGGGTLPYVYTWQPSGGNVPNLANLVAGTYTCVIKSGTEVFTQTIEITQPLALTATFLQTNVLVNGQATGAIT